MMYSFLVNQPIPWGKAESVAFINPRFPQDQVETLLQTLQQALDLLDQSLKSHVFVLTSGTTAQSVYDFKWVALSQLALMESASAINQHLQNGLHVTRSTKDTWIHNLPDFHVGGVGIQCRALLSGARVVRLSHWKCDEFLNAIVCHHGTLSALVPTQLYDLVKAEFRCPNSMRAIFVGGGALSIALYQKARALGWPVLPTYGMTETASQIATASLDSLSISKSIDIDSIPNELPPMQILPHFQIKIGIDQKIWISGKSLLSAYLYQFQGQFFAVDPKEQGWFCSQDLGKKQDHFLQPLGRVGDFVKIGGESVEVGRLRSILEKICIEEKISADVALIAMPDERLGHVIHFISDPTLDHLRGHRIIELFNQQVLGFEKIRHWRIMDVIPRTELGKLKISVDSL